MLLSGTFGKASTSQVLNLINLSRKSGVLQIVNHSVANNLSPKTAKTESSIHNRPYAEIYFRDGWVLAASLGKLQHHLAETLYRGGKLSQHRMELLLKDNRNLTDQQLALALINRGYFNKSDLLKAVRYHTLEIIAEVMKWGDKHFEFHHDLPDLSAYILVMINPQEIITDTARLSYEQKQLEEAIPDLNLTLRFIDDSGERFKDVALDADEWRVVGYINTNRTVQQIAQACNMTDMEIRRIVWALNSAGVIKLENTPDAPPKTGNSFGSDKLRKLETQMLDILKSGISRLQKQDVDNLGITSPSVPVETKHFPSPAIKPLPATHTKSVPQKPETALRRSHWSSTSAKKASDLLETQEATPVVVSPSKPAASPKPALPPTPTVPPTSRTIRAESSIVQQPATELPATKAPLPMPVFPDEIQQSKWSASKTRTLSFDQQRDRPLQLCPRCHHKQDPLERECTVCGFNLHDVDSLIELVGLRAIEDVDLPNRPHLPPVYFRQGWLVLDFGKKQLTLSIDKKFILGHSKIDTSHYMVDITPYGDIASIVNQAHAVIYSVENIGLVLADLGSENGTFLNNKVLLPFVPYRLFDGDILRLASFDIKAQVIEKLDGLTVRTS